MGELASLRNHYIEVWRQLLVGWLNWSEQSFAAWVAIYDADLNDSGNPLFYHEEPLYYVVPQLIPQEVRNRLARERSERSYNGLGELIGDLHAAIAGWPILESWGKPDFDWVAAKQRVCEVLDRFGARLPARTS